MDDISLPLSECSATFDTCDYSVDPLMGGACGDAIGFLLEQCDPCPHFPPPWDRIEPSRDCRQAVSRPDEVLRVLRSRYDDDVLRAANLLVESPDGAPALRPRLCTRGGYLFAIREPHDRQVIDLLTTSRGALRSQLRGVQVPILPAAAGKSSFGPITVLATVDQLEAALLRSLDVPVVLLRGLRTRDLGLLKNFWTPSWSTESGPALPTRGDAGNSDMTSPADGYELLFVGCSLLRLTEEIPDRLRKNLEYLFEANTRLGLGLDLPDVWMPTAEQLGDLRFALYMHALRPMRQWFEDVLLSSRTRLPEFCSPREKRLAKLTHASASSKLLALLTNRQLRNLAPRHPGNAPEWVQRAHDDFVAVVERDFVEPILNNASRSRIVYDDLVRQIAETVRAIRIVEPYVMAHIKPTDLGIDFNTGAGAIEDYMAGQEEKYLTLVKVYASMMGRRR